METTGRIESAKTIELVESKGSLGRRLARIAILALVLSAMMGGVLGGTRDAAAGNGYEQWVLDANGQCIRFWDGYSYTLAGCSRADGGVDIYYASGGQWVYLSSSGYLSDGGTWFYYQGIYYYNTVSNGYVNGIYPTSYTSGGTTYEGLTNNPVANQFFIDASTGSGSVWTAPSCVYNLRGICYY
jgi:hypothetical protein